jgi:hypothetical protein
VTATDADTLAAGATISYSIEGGNTGTVFAVDAAGGAVYITDNTALNYESTTQFDLTVRYVYCETLQTR